MLGILMVATEPLAARRRWCLPSLECSEATNRGGSPEISVRWTSCSGWIICNMFAVIWILFLWERSRWVVFDHCIFERGGRRREKKELCVVIPDKVV